jgi:hypothetical protein
MYTVDDEGGAGAKRDMEQIAKGENDRVESRRRCERKRAKRSEGEEKKV